MKKIPPRFKNQDETLARIIAPGSTMLFDTSDPGTGKTRSQLDGIMAGSGNRSTLVIAPKNLLQAAWGNDIDKFTPDLTYSIAQARNREKMFKKQADVYITNTDAAKWIAKQSPKFFEKFDRLIIDESSKFKNPFSQRSAAMDAIAPYFDYRYCLTGTPNPNDLTDLWHQVFLLDQGDRLGTMYYAFRNTVCDAIAIRGANVSPHARKWLMKPGMDVNVAQLIADINIRHVFEECQDIPKNHVTHIKYDMNRAASLQYDQLKKTAILQLQEGYVIGVNAATLLSKLMQSCSGSVYTESGDPGTVDSQQTDMVVELVEERQKSVVFFQWRHQRDALIAAFKKQKISYTLVDGTVKSDVKRQLSIKHFQGGLYRVFLTHPASAAHGLTLTRGTSTIWASLGWNLEEFIQGIRRIYRAGQKEKTETILLTANGTVEEDVYARLMAKDKVQSTVLDILKELSVHYD
jgi:SNF2 family DNA or RNA helicase